MNFWELNFMEIIDGRKIRTEILKKVKAEVAMLPLQPVFCDVLVGTDPASVQYVGMKAKTATSVGIKFHSADFPATITTEELVKEIEKLNKIPNMCGIIIQLPLPPSIDKRAVLDAIEPKLDVDFLGSEASNLFYSGGAARGGGFPTALACMVILDILNLDLTNKKIVVLGQGDLVGKPVSALLRFRNLEPVIITSKTENKEALLKNADVIISGIGKGKYITGSMIKEGAVIIDAGTSEMNNAVVGDVDLESVKDVASFVSPVPGGVGPVTVAMLLQNVLNVAKNLE
jgi:methylenetetrahydrofolate dehydrogenase (NADP+)/methenyltetrahydrofolate cyclohydrolase